MRLGHELKLPCSQWLMSPLYCTLPVLDWGLFLVPLREKKGAPCVFDSLYCYKPLFFYLADIFCKVIQEMLCLT